MHDFSQCKTSKYTKVRHIQLTRSQWCIRRLHEGHLHSKGLDLDSPRLSVTKWRLRPRATKLRSGLSKLQA